MEAAPIRIDRKPSIETEPRTLGMDQIEFAREAAKYVVNTKNIEEAMRIFTEGLEPVVSSIQQSGDEVMMASVEEPEYSEDYYRRPRGPRKIVSAPFSWDQPLASPPQFTLPEAKKAHMAFQYPPDHYRVIYMMRNICL